MAVKQSKAVIQDATDFFAWACSSQSEIEYQFVTQDEYERHNQQIELRKNEIRPVKGTMVLHAVATYTDGSERNLLTRETTCVCDNCFGEEGFKRGSDCIWETASLKNVTARSKEPELDKTTNDKNEMEAKVDVSDFVVGRYDGTCYVGQVIEIDLEDHSVFINFMAPSGKSVKRFRWPSKPDQIWIEQTNVLRKIEPPQATGKGGRIFSVPAEVMSFMEINNS